MVTTGLERFCGSAPGWVSDRRLGLLCNSASVNRRFRHASRCIEEALPGRLRALFSPQHGFFAERQDNMVESDHAIDPVLKIPIYSLYGETRVPTEEMMDGIDVLLVDLQDAGTRVYTFASTVTYCLQAAKRFGKKVLILDRPNPINGVSLEGNCMVGECFSFVGLHPIPMRHGLTLGELMLLANRAYGIGCELSVVPMEGWHREMYFSDTGLPWVAPSPNLPTPASAMVYPGQVLWEGTNISEGRGTTQPFEMFGAPFVEPAAVCSRLEGPGTGGVVLRPLSFEPTSNKWSGKCCRGFQIHITDPARYAPYMLSLKLLQILFLLYPDQFQWKQPPYEYEYKRLPIDLILGDRRLRERIESGDPIDEVADSWQKELAEFSGLCSDYYLYRTQR